MPGLNTFAANSCSHTYSQQLADFTDTRTHLPSLPENIMHSSGSTVALTSGSHTEKQCFMDESQRQNKMTTTA